MTAKSTTITSSGSPTAVGIASFANEFDAGYCIVQVSDTSNNRHQLSEVLIIDDDDEVYLTEYANIETFAGLGTMGGVRTGDRTELTFTPNSGIDVHVKTFTHALRDTEEVGDISENVQLNNIAIEDNFSVYTGTEVEVKKDFFLTHKDNPVFLRVFDGSSDSIIDVDASTILVPNHFFVSGEEVTYTTSGVSTNSIGIAIPQQFLVLDQLINCQKLSLLLRLMRRRFNLQQLQRMLLERFQSHLILPLLVLAHLMLLHPPNRTIKF